jgi:hypothetical protein
VIAHFDEGEDSFAEATLSERVFALDTLMFDLLLLFYSKATAFTHHLHKAAVVQFMSSKQKFVVGKLVVTLAIVTPKSNLRNQFLFQSV